jgi:hypothetical protein
MLLPIELLNHILNFVDFYTIESMYKNHLFENIIDEKLMLKRVENQWKWLNLACDCQQEFDLKAYLLQLIRNIRNENHKTFNDSLCDLIEVADVMVPHPRPAFDQSENGDISIIGIEISIDSIRIILCNGGLHCIRNVRNPNHEKIYSRILHPSEETYDIDGAVEDLMNLKNVPIRHLHESRDHEDEGFSGNSDDLTDEDTDSTDEID